MRVIQGTASRPGQSAIEAAYDHFRVDRQGNLVSANTLDHYHYLVRPFFDWLRDASGRGAVRGPGRLHRSELPPGAGQPNVRAHGAALRTGGHPRRPPAADHLPALGGG